MEYRQIRNKKTRQRTGRASYENLAMTDLMNAIQAFTLRAPLASNNVPDIIVTLSCESRSVNDAETKKPLRVAEAFLRIEPWR